ncbi:MAG: GNAT family N-acetyltransferase [Lachnospiraceae bacterium]|nr:GNAT family N-acetyltransferase [Lachnospiraceae bacterium]
MVEVIAYEMNYDKASVEQSTISCIPFDVQYFEQYKSIYNECFYDMRKALEIEPYNFLNDYGQIKEKADDIYLLMKDSEIIGSVACYGNEIDDLIVNKKFQKRGYGKQLLLWGMQQIRKKNADSITLHVAEWNRNALRLYKKVGFEVIHCERVR